MGSQWRGPWRASPAVFKEKGKLICRPTLSMYKDIGEYTNKIREIQSLLVRQLRPPMGLGPFRCFPKSPARWGGSQKQAPTPPH